MSTAFHEEHSPLILGDLRLFKQELASLVKVNFSSFRKDVDSLPIGEKTHTLAFLVFLGQEFHCFLGLDSCNTLCPIM